VALTTSRRAGHVLAELARPPLRDRGAARGERRAGSRDRICSLVSLIDSTHNCAETMAYTEEKGNHSSQKYPRKPELPS
jgi:hypothetical protein